MSKTSIRWVIKLGGSLAQSDSLGIWLKSLADLPCVIVPGGGPFADAVRKIQQDQGFDDLLAHELAIRAMGLYGRMLFGMEPRLHIVQSVKEISGKQPLGAPLLWLPDPKEPCLQGLKASWEVTSDTISALLALELEIPQLLLVKSLEPPEREERLPNAIRAGLVDPALREMVEDRTLTLWLKGPNPEGLAKGLEDPVSSFTALLA